MNKLLLRRHDKSIGICLALLLITLAVFWQASTHEFINFDDLSYVTSNPHVKGGFSRDNVFWAFTTTTEANWHPLTWLSHMADSQLFGLNPAGHHLMNVLFHGANTLLLFHLLFRLTGCHWKSAFVSAIFALHPLHVESVAWVSERKDVLSTLFWLLAIWAYVRYVERRDPLRYTLTLLFFSAGLMAKPMLVTLPLVLLLLDFWPLGRWQRSANVVDHQSCSPRRLVLEKTPFLFLAFASSFITYHVQQKEGAVASLSLLPVYPRVENAFIAYVQYLSKTIWPSRLAIFYPFKFDLPIWQVAGSILLLACVTLLVWRKRRRYPYLFVGWLWYLITLVPVIGFVKVGSQSMADRYTYLPLIGIFIAIAWYFPALFKELRLRGDILAVTAAIILTLYALCAYKQLGYWQNSITLYNHSVSVTSPNSFILDNLASAYLERGRLDEAIEQSKLALTIDPNDYKAHFILGLVYDRQGKTSDALVHYSESVRIKPDYIEALNNLGRILTLQGNYDKALDCFSAILNLDPDNQNAQYNLKFVEQRLEH